MNLFLVLLKLPTLHDLLKLTVFFKTFYLWNSHMDKECDEPLSEPSNKKSQSELGDKHRSSSRRSRSSKSQADNSHAKQVI